MSVEDADDFSELDPNLPANSDPAAEGAAHIRLLKSTAQTHTAETGGVHGIPAGERALHTGDDLQSDSTPIGGYVFVQSNLTGAEAPDPERYIKLEADLTGGGEYNEGKLTNESVSGSSPLVEATAEIADSESPLFGQVVHLLETEERFLRAGQAGRVQNDQMQRITGMFRGDGTYRNGSTTTSGAFSNSSSGVSSFSGNNPNGTQFNFNSANSVNSRTSSTNSGETRAKNIGVSMYMRIK